MVDSHCVAVLLRVNSLETALPRVPARDDGNISEKLILACNVIDANQEAVGERSLRAMKT